MTMEKYVMYELSVHTAGACRGCHQSTETLVCVNKYKYTHYPVYILNELQKSFFNLKCKLSSTSNR